MATEPPFTSVYDDSESQDAASHISQIEIEPSLLNKVDSFLSQQCNGNSGIFIAPSSIATHQQSNREQGQGARETASTEERHAPFTNPDPLTAAQEIAHWKPRDTAQPPSTVSFGLEDRFAEIAPSLIPDLNLEQPGSEPLPDDEEEGGGECDEVALRSQCNRMWILNFIMIKRDGQPRWEKLFVTYIETPTKWRRVTIPMDYSDVPPNSLEADLESLFNHSDKHLHVFRSLRGNLSQIPWVPTVTRLRLATSREDGELNINFKEDIAELIDYPPISSFAHIDTLKVPECEVEFDAHLSGYVFKVRVHGEILVKKEIPHSDAIDQFLYEVNALDTLDSLHVARLKGLVTDNDGETVKAVLIAYASKGALIDILWEMDEYEATFPNSRREKWGHQIIRGVSDLHEAGYVHGDFTLSNIVIDEDDNAQIIDMNRRGCPIGCEPPELRKLMESNQSIKMTIGVKTDIFQLGMVLWALATGCSEPAQTPQPLPRLSKVIPKYFRDIVQTCLSDKPEDRSSAKDLLALFQTAKEGNFAAASPPDVWPTGDVDLRSSSNRLAIGDQQYQFQNVNEEDDDILSGISSRGYHLSADLDGRIETPREEPTTVDDRVNDDHDTSLVGLSDFETLDLHRLQSLSSAPTSTSWHVDSSNSWVVGRHRGNSGDEDNQEDELSNQDQEETQTDEAGHHESLKNEDGDQDIGSSQDEGGDDREDEDEYEDEYDQHEEGEDEEDIWSQEEASRGSSMADEAVAQPSVDEEIYPFQSAAEPEQPQLPSEHRYDHDTIDVPEQRQRRKRSWSGRGGDDTST